jgi:exopolyphosphatase/guanosine-5'-triphosphate,3'-diphosphate pyrophosphatase
LPGFTEREQEIVANVARYHRKSPPSLRHAEYKSLDEGDRKTVSKLAAILRIADGLDRDHSQSVQEVQCSQKDQGITITLKSGHRAASTELDIWGAERKKDLFEEIYQMPVTFEQE